MGKAPKIDEQSILKITSVFLHEICTYLFFTTKYNFVVSLNFVVSPYSLCMTFRGLSHDNRDY